MTERSGFNPLEMVFQEIRFFCRGAPGISFGDMPGVWFHGGFGEALMSEGSGAFEHLFRVESALLGPPNLPPPVRFCVGDLAGASFRGRFDFAVFLLGARAVGHASLVSRVVCEMGAVGFGSARSGRGPGGHFTVDRIQESDVQSLLHRSKQATLEWQKHGCEPVTIAFETPVVDGSRRIRTDLADRFGHYLGEAAYSIARRALDSAFDPATTDQAAAVAIAEDVRLQVQRSAAETEVKESELRIVRHAGVPSGSNTGRVYLSGVEGHLVLGGHLEPVFPWLVALEPCGLGSATGYGMGETRVCV